MTRSGWIQIAALYWPLLMALVVGVWIRPSSRQRIGVLFGCAWTAGVLPLVDGLAQMAGLWDYAPATFQLGGMPLALYAAWIALWGGLGALLTFRFGVWPVVAGMAILDLACMPQLQPVLRLSHAWPLGEAALLLLVLLPGVLLAVWTAGDLHVSRRAILLAVCFSLITLLLSALSLAGDLPAVIQQIRQTPAPIAFPTGLMLLVSVAAGWSAMRDLALDGGGTPVPLDPTRRLVTTGIYGYLANPMQMGMTVIILAEGLFLRSGWPVALAALTVIYSAGFARWSESVDMPARYGDVWHQYRREVRSWLPRMHLCSGHACHLYVDFSCGMCSQLGRWFSVRRPLRLEIRDATGMPFRRITWRDPVTGREESGVMAVARALQHLHLGWALIGWLASLPGVAPVMQICMDASGTAPAIKD